MSGLNNSFEFTLSLKETFPIYHFPFLICHLFLELISLPLGGVRGGLEAEIVFCNLEVSSTEEITSKC